MLQIFLIQERKEIFSLTDMRIYDARWNTIDGKNISKTIIIPAPLQLQNELKG